MLITTIERARNTCCRGCRAGAPCCGTAKPRPAFERRRGLWLPRRDLTLPKALLGWPSEAEWGGLIRPWQPALVQTFDLSCLPCCRRVCAACDPCEDDPGEFCDPLNVVITGVLSATGTLERAASTTWRYEGFDIFLDAGGCGDAAWTALDVFVYCDEATEQVRIGVSGGSASCGVAAPTDKEAAWSCTPFEASATFETAELIEAGCPCGPGEEFTVTIFE